MKIYIYSFLFIQQFLFAQFADTLKLTDPNQFARIDSIIIQGNEITEEFIITRELTFIPGDEVNQTLLKYNRERVYSLGLFNYVEFYLIQDEEKINLVIDVLEKWYLYPLPFVYLNEDDFDKATYGINFKLENFRGRNETLSAYIGLGYDPRVRFSYTIPAFLYKEGIGLGFQIAYQDFSNKSNIAETLVGNDFDYTIYTGAISINKRLDQFNLFELMTGYSYIATDGISLNGITASGNTIDRYPFMSLAYVYDSRDLKQFSKTGLLTSAQILHKGFGIEGVAYQIFELDLRQYNQVVEDITARWRVNYRSAFGKTIPYYDYSFLGYSEYIRGHRKNEMEGLQYLLGSFEMSYSIVDEWHLSLDLPLLPKSLTSTRIGVNFNIFTDAGVTYDHFKELKLNNFISGYGFGLNILFLPFNAVRFEYAFDEYMNGEFIIGVGFSF